EVFPSPNGATFFAATYLGETLFVFDDQGRGYRHSPNGSFLPISLSRQVSFFTASADGPRGYVVGTCGTILKTINSGETWEVVNAPIESMNGLLVAGSSLFVTGFDGVFRSDDGAQS